MLFKKIFFFFLSFFNYMLRKSQKHILQTPGPFVLRGFFLNSHSQWSADGKKFPRGHEGKFKELLGTQRFKE